jgi:hypothetical protein
VIGHRPCGQEVMMVPKDKEGRKEDSRQRALWAYSYQIVPPRLEDEMADIHTFLEEEQSEARRSARTWVGKLVREQKVTHILIVTDSPDQSADANRELEGRLKRLKLEYNRTAPMAVSDVGQGGSGD